MAKQAQQVAEEMGLYPSVFRLGMKLGNKAKVGQYLAVDNTLTGQQRRVDQSERINFMRGRQYPHSSKRQAA